MIYLHLVIDLLNHFILRVIKTLIFGCKVKVMKPTFSRKETHLHFGLVIHKGRLLEDKGGLLRNKDRFWGNRGSFPDFSHCDNLNLTSIPTRKA